MRDKRRLVEWGKTLLIVLLSLSALYLLSMTPLIQDSGVKKLLPGRPTEQHSSASVTLAAAALPSRMAVTGEGGRLGVQYDQTQVNELFSVLGPLLGEALVSAEGAERISEGSWKERLQKPGIYFDFTGEIPLAALGSWLEPEKSCTLKGAARRVLLACGEDDRVLLCYQSAGDGLFYACATGLSQSLHLLPAVANTAVGEASFAFENSWGGALDPYMLVTENPTRHAVQAGDPLASEENVAKVLSALDYTGRSHASVSGGELYLEGSDRLLVGENGTVNYNAAQGGKYPVASVQGRPTLSESIETARNLAERTVGSLCGDAELYLISADEGAEGSVICFGYRLDGSTVWYSEEGWAAEVRISGGFVTEYTLHFRSYTLTDSEELLLSADRAAALLSALTDRPCELVLRYHDRGESILSPAWVAQ